MSRGSESLASSILRTTEDTNETGDFLVFYDFKTRATAVFYTNLKKIQHELQDGVRIQKSVIQCKKLCTARAIKKLAEHYKADVLLFKVELRE